VISSPSAPLNDLGSRLANRLSHADTQPPGLWDWSPSVLAGTQQSATRCHSRPGDQASKVNVRGFWAHIEKLRTKHGIRFGQRDCEAAADRGRLMDPAEAQATEDSTAQIEAGVRACIGELVQIDGCEHHWFEDRGPACAALVSIDDATRLMQILFNGTESTFGYFEATRRNSSASKLRRMLSSGAQPPCPVSRLAPTRTSVKLALILRVAGERDRSARSRNYAR
jgi:hypothetical protein